MLTEGVVLLLVLLCVGDIARLLMLRSSHEPPVVMVAACRDGLDKQPNQGQDPDRFWLCLSYFVIIEHVSLKMCKHPLL